MKTLDRLADHFGLSKRKVQCPQGTGYALVLPSCGEEWTSDEEIFFFSPRKWRHFRWAVSSHHTIDLPLRFGKIDDLVKLLYNGRYEYIDLDSIKKTKWLDLHNKIKKLKQMSNRPEIGTTVFVKNDGGLYSTHLEMRGRRNFKYGYAFTGKAKVVGYTKFDNCSDVILLNDGNYTAAFSYESSYKKYIVSAEYAITAGQAQSIINAACATWKEKLIDKWAVDILHTRDILITSEEYSEMRKACTPSQNELFDEIFLKEEKVVFYSIGDRFVSIYGDEYMLAHVHKNEVILINLQTGARWTHPAAVVDRRQITVQEFDVITARDSNKFTKL
jgi:hypothetical protein